jgi:hypothetical protein
MSHAYGELSLHPFVLPLHLEICEISSLYVIWWNFAIFFLIKVINKFSHLLIEINRLQLNKLWLNIWCIWVFLTCRFFIVALIHMVCFLTCWVWGLIICVNGMLRLINQFGINSGVTAFYKRFDLISYFVSTLIFAAVNICTYFLFQRSCLSNLVWRLSSTHLHHHIVLFLLIWINNKITIIYLLHKAILFRLAYTKRTIILAIFKELKKIFGFVGLQQPWTLSNLICFL